LESVNTILPSILSFGAPLEDSQKSVILINSNDHPIYNCTQNLKFLEIQGTVPITLVLSEIIKHGYVLEIYSTVPVIINGQKYSESSFKIRRLEKSWILYNNTAVSIEIL
jgi:hypothetical protein